jgi:hypothetical protein
MNWYKGLTKNKTFEIQSDIFDDKDTWFEFQIKWTRKGDHAGFNLTIEILKWYFCINIHDNRHWNYKEDRWMTKEDYLLKEEKRKVDLCREDGPC